MNLRAYYIVLFFCVAASPLFSQNLRDLREVPDTSIVKERNDIPLNIRSINVPIPSLGLSVNYWKHWSKFGINLNQASFSDNWGAGGVNSTAWSSLMWHKSEYNRGDFNFTTEVDLRYGKIKNENQLAKKNNDRIFWDNKLAYKFARNWSIFTSVTFESVFDVGYNYTRNPDTNEEQINPANPVRTAFMAPGYFTESFGLEYKPDNSFSLRFGTGTARQTFVLDDRILPGSDGTRFGVEEGKKMRNELAFQLTANLDRDLHKNLNLKSRYNLFADYQEIGKPDHRLDATLTAKITSLISVTLNGVMVYDRAFIAEGDDRAKVQWSQSLAMGLLYSLPR